MKAFRGWLAAITAFGVLSAASLASATYLWPDNMPTRPALYLIKGYLDHAPAEALVTDEIQIFAPGAQSRQFFITEYRTPGETPLDRYLSRVLGRRFALMGRKEFVHLVSEAPPGAEVAGKFLAYTTGYPTLVIAELETPAPPA
jgi:hypothetical protein